MKKIKIMMLALLLAAVSSYATVYVNETFEGYTVGTNPPCTYSTPGGSATNLATLTNAHVWVVASSPINKGQALEFVDNNTTNGVRYEQGVLNATTGTLSSLRWDFTFSPLRTDGSSEQYINAGVTTNGGNTGSSAQRFVVLRMYPNGQARFQAGAIVNAVGPYITYASGTVHKVSMYLNDGASAITYTDPLNTSSTNVLAANFAAFYFDDVFVTNGGLQSSVSGTTNGLGKVGFGATTAASNIYYAIDNIRVTDVNYVSIPEYLLTVNNGIGDGSYIAGTVVPIMADTSDTNKTFVVWIGDTQYVGDPSSASTTVTMPSNAVTVTATYNKGLLTVNNGTAADNGTYLTNGAVETITANAGPANQTFARWIGDVANVANVYSETTTVTIVNGQNVTLTATYAGFFHDYEDEATLGVAPSNGPPLMIPTNADTYCIVVGGITNTAATGQAVELKDNSWLLGMGFEYNITGAGNSGISAARASFAFSWKDLGGTAYYSLAASFGEYAGARSMSGSAARWTEARLNDNGTLTVSANGSTPFLDNPIQLISDTANTLNVFANDSDSQSVVYTVNGANYTLPANSVAYWVSGQLVTFSGASNVSLDVAEVPVGGGTIGTTENNLGKFGFSSSSSTLGIDYIIDNFQARALSATPEALYSLVVNFGGSGGLYTNGQQVVIKAHPAVGKNFLHWSGDTAALANSNNATTTVTMPAAGITLTAIYDVNVLTVINGTGSGTYTNGQQVAIAANPAPAGKVFERWGGDVDIANVVNVFAANTTLTMPDQNITVIAQYAGMFQNFENDTVGAVPTNGSPIVSTNVLVVASGANTAGTGQAVELIDNDPLQGTGLEYDVANGKPALSAAKASFAFAWKNIGTGFEGDNIAVAFGEYDSTMFRRLGSAARRWTEARLVEDGTVDFASTGATTNSADDVSNNNNALVENMKNTMTIFANDYDSTAVSYTVNGATYSLPANSVAYWLNGRSILFGTNAYASLDMSDINASGDAIGTTEGNLGKFGFSAGTTATGLDYIIDDLAVSDDPWAALYSLVVNGGGGGGLYTNGQQVVISANPGRTFVAWIGEVSYLSANTANAVVTMPAAGVTLTAIYTDTILTVIGGTGSGSYTNGDVAPISASDTRPGVSFREWIGSGATYVANVTATNTTVLLPMQDITVIATYNYYLTITNGSGSGNYTNNATVAIVASNLVGKTFDQWIGDTNLLSSNVLSTTVTMSTNPATLTATYVDTLYTLTITNGSGSGVYTNGTVVQICADDPPLGMVFFQWVGDTAYLADPNAACTTLIMPAHDITLTATYGFAPVLLTLTGQGSAGGSVSPASTNVLFGGSATFTITASNFYRIATLTTNGTAVTGVTFSNSSTSYTYIWSNAQADGVLAATFTPQIVIPPEVTAHGTPYLWLAGYGLTNYEADDLLDQDSDGMITWKEYRAGTVPTNRNSVLKAAGSVLSGEHIGISWFGVQDRVYTFQYQYGDALHTNNWQSVPGEIPGANAVVSLTNSLTGGVSNAFYRVKVRLGDLSTLAANMLGCTKITLPSNQYVLVSFDFDNQNNTISNLFRYLPTGSVAELWNAANQSYTTCARTRAGWGVSGTNRIQRGSGAFVKLPAGGAQTNLLLSGDVPTAGTTTLYKTNGYTLLAYPYPVRIAFTNTALAKTAATGDQLSLWNNGWTTYSRTRAGWGAAGNYMRNPGQAFFFRSTSSGPVNEMRPYVVE